jgi:hypothetical protein
MFRKVLPILLLAAARLAQADEDYARAADIKPGRFSMYQQSHETLAQLNDVGLFWDHQLGLQQGCKNPYQVKPVNLVLLRPVHFPDAADFPTQGMWRVRFEYERCNELKTYNAIFVAISAGRPHVVPSMPGTTDVPPVLGQDALKGMFLPVQKALAAAGAKNCKEIFPFDTRLTPGAADKPDADVWQEKWTFQGCGRQVQFLMTFSPNDKDGHYFKGVPLK